MRPILFNTDMVRAIQEDRKTVTRRVVKVQDQSCSFSGIKYLDGAYAVFAKGRSTGFEMVKAPYQPGDILYVRETWAVSDGEFYYRADTPIFTPWEVDKWRPSIHMPKEAARIFLRVTDVRVERLQEITEEQARAEGAKPVSISVDPEETPEDKRTWREVAPAKLNFASIWDSTIKSKDRDMYGWDANPWVFVIEFERISKENAMACVKKWWAGR